MPFDYSMHNYLLRYYVAEHGLDPDQDIQIRAVPPPEMVANLRADNIDGFLGARSDEPARGLRRRRLHPHPVEGNLGRPSLLRVRGVEGIRHRDRRTPTRRCSRRSSTRPRSRTKPENRKQIAEAIAPANYLNQPVTVVEQVLTGTFADGLGNVQKVPEPHRFRSVPLAVVRGLDHDADEALGSDQGRRRLRRRSPSRSSSRPTRRS